MADKAKVLVVDDERINRKQLSELLEDGYEVAVAKNGEQALQRLNAAPDIDLILLDVMMPDLDGYETCRRIKAIARLERIPVIFVTALNEAGAEATGLALGAADYLTKPLNPVIARQRIHNLLERERLRIEVENHRNHLEHLVEARTSALAIAKEAAEGASRAKSAFLATMSHELRTPMHAIMGLTDIVLRRAENPRQKEQLGKIRQASQHLFGLIEQLLDVTRLEADHLTLDMAPFQLETVLEPVLRLCKPAAQAKGLAFDLEAPEALVRETLLGDAQRLTQVLLELAQNAIKFTSYGLVQVDVSQISADDGFCELRFSVQDSGIGVASEDQQRIFTLFEQADGSMTRNYGGSGLGLAISQQLVRLMGGHINLVSQSGSGSEFWFTIRLEKGKAPIVAETRLAGEALEQHVRGQYAGTRVLVGESSLFAQGLLLMVLEDAGFDIDMVTDGASLLVKAQQCDYALILINFELPQLNGLETLQVIRTCPGCADLPIIGLTDVMLESSPGDEHSTLITEWIPLPIDPDVLLTSVLRALGQRGS